MEDYKKKYEEALGRARTFSQRWQGIEATDSELALQELKEIFPELKESEDERIRKELVDFLTYGIWHGPVVDKVKQSQKYAEWIGYLEKQDPKKHEEELEKAYKTADEVQYRKGFEDAKREFEKQGEQKPAWSEEDDDNIMMIEDRLSDYLDYIREDSTLTKHQKNCLKEKVIGYVNWLKSLKERMKGE